MNEVKEPIFKSIFGDDWKDLPIVMKKHYANHPYSDDLVVVQGKMDIKFNWFGKLCAPIFKIFNTLIPYQGSGVDTVVSYNSDQISKYFYLKRVLNFPNKKPVIFASKLLQIKDDKVVELMPGGLGWVMSYKYENGLVRLKHKGYIIRIFGLMIPLPLGLIMGKGYAEEKALSDDSFEMIMTITHFLWGRVYEYKGKFNITKNV